LLDISFNLMNINRLWRLKLLGGLLTLLRGLLIFSNKMMSMIFEMGQFMMILYLGEIGRVTFSNGDLLLLW
jgi:hypothetical protein